jgi:hypothetical protein
LAFLPVFLILGVLSFGASSAAASVSRPVIAKTAPATRVKAQVSSVERGVRKLQRAAQHACAEHRNDACVTSRRRLAESAASLSRLRRVLKSTLSESARSSAGSSAVRSDAVSSGSASASATSSTPTAATTADSDSASPASTSATFEPGLDSNADATTSLTGAAMLGAKLVRYEFTIGSTVAQLEPVIAAFAARGIRVLPLAGFYGTLPSAAEAANLASWARAFGPGGTFWAGRSDGSLAIRSIEFGNETSYGYQYGDSAGSPSYMARAKTYAVRFKEAAEAISSTGINVGLLAQADDWTGDWMNGMFSAVPNLSQYVAGWTIHPYTTNWQTRLEDLISQAAAHGAPSSIPIDITEWGVSTDNGRCLSENYGHNPCMSYQEAATTLTSTESSIRTMLGGRLGTFIVYQTRDQAPSGASNEREAYFGALQQNLQPKGAYTTAVESLLASS